MSFQVGYITTTLVQKLKPAVHVDLSSVERERNQSRGWIKSSSSNMRWQECSTKIQKTLPETGAWQVSSTPANSLNQKVVENDTFIHDEPVRLTSSIKTWKELSNCGMRRCRRKCLAYLSLCRYSEVRRRRTGCIAECFCLVRIQLPSLWHTSWKKGISLMTISAKKTLRSTKSFWLTSCAKGRHATIFCSAYQLHTSLYCLAELKEVFQQQGQDQGDAELKNTNE